MKLSRPAHGFTLIELMIVVAVIAIIAAVAIPSYNSSVMKSKRSIGKAALMDVLARQEQSFINNKVYALLLTDLGFPADPYFVDDNGSPVAAAGGIYRIALQLPTTTTFTIQAIPVNGQATDGCATLTLTSAGTKGVSGGTLGVADCW